MARLFRSIALAATTVVALSLVYSEPETRWSVSTDPFGAIPLGSSSKVFGIGAGMEASFAYLPSFMNTIGLKAGGRYLYLPLASPIPDRGVWAASGFLGPLLSLPLGERLTVSAEARAGYYYWGGSGWDAGQSTGGGLSFGGAAGASFRLAGNVTLGAGVGYDYYSELYNGLGLSLAVRFEYPGLPSLSEALLLEDVRLNPLFPVLYSYYATHPVGTATVVNNGKTAVKDVSVSFQVERYMDGPMTVGASFNLAPGERRTIELFALFNESLMDITEGTKLAAKIRASYPLRNGFPSKEAVAVLESYNRNAMTWDDDRRLASFITAKDPEILNFAKNIGTWSQAVRNPAIDENLQKAIALFEAIKAYGVHYEIDPVTPFSRLSEDLAAIDFIQFPRQTLQFTNGDCDDLTALYAALLEAIGVESAFITVPGHIFAAFALKATEDEARKSLGSGAELVYLHGKAWVPVEITLFQDTFDKAWQSGAKQWREHVGGAAAFYPTREAWAVYSAVGFASGGSVALPDRDAVVKASKASLDRIIERELRPQLAAQRLKVEQSGGAPRHRNALALVYARYGRYEEALKEFLDIVKRHGYAPSMVNAGNVYFIQGDYAKALLQYERVVAQDAANLAALVGLARCNYEMENYGVVKKTFEQIKRADPGLAERFAYLESRGDDSARASDMAGLKAIVVWKEE